ncbi:hypothetical protein LCGC14_0457960 [marine sediment metagenome]|uniref:Uncharacterized protein n=1 Tax=marine sediment metagenome TaxID=412755 RepID=A0A0F9VPT7_9ZZZZ
MKNLLAFILVFGVGSIVALALSAVSIGLTVWAVVIVLKWMEIL